MLERFARSYILQCAILAIAYYSATKLSFTLIMATEQFSFIFLASSLAVAVILLAGYRLWPGILVGALLLGVTVNNSGTISVYGLSVILVLSIIAFIIAGRLQTAQRLIKEKTAEIQSRDAVFHTVMDNAVIGMASVSTEGQFLKVNKSLCSMLGYNEQELIGNNFEAISHPDDLHKNMQYIHQSMKGDITSFTMEKRLIGKNSQTVSVMLNVTLAPGGKENADHYIMQFLDIGARVEMDRLKSEFISTVSHELRTPLTSIRGALGLIAGGVLGKIPDKAAEFVRIAHKNSERLILIINDILDIEKVEAGKMAIVSRPVNVKQILLQSIEINQTYSEKYKVQFILKKAPEDTQVIADPDRLIQILTKLLSNGAKFSHPNSEVWIGAEDKGDKVVFSVRDFGDGIPDEFRPRMFEKFSRADNSDARKTDGTGLGLRITAKLIEAMKGKIDFETEIGKGTCFYFTLPKLIPESAPIAVAPTGSNLPHAILICEDDKTMSGLIKAYLERAGFTTDTAYNIAEARRKLQDKTFSAMTMDIMLPDGSGVDFVEELRKHPETHDLPVVIVSGRASESKKTMQGNRIGVVDWLDKPSEAAKLNGGLIHSLKRAVSGDIERLPHILHIEDDSDLSHILSSAMMEHAIVVNAPTLGSAKKWLEHTYFDLVVMDIELPDGSGLNFLKKLKDIAEHPVPVIILSASEVDAETQKQVSTSLVKSRVSENYIIDRIMAMVAHSHRKGALQ
ncbi:MAG: response regulator [Alphaproteobacteria bacterium]|nr:MAG: response regulator [Alphaproteobacteria bacterium]